MRTPTDRFAFALVSLVMAACSSAPLTNDTSPDGGPADAEADAADAQFEEHADRCALTAGVLPSAQADCAPCLGRSFVEGLSCGDLAVGFQCEVGDHPAWACNDLWECDANHEWTLLSAANTSAVCSRSVVQGLPCDPLVVSCLRKVGVACMDDLKEHVLVFGSEPQVLNLESHTRFGCPCTRPDLARCSFAEVCIDGSWRRKATAPCLD